MDGNLAMANKQVYMTEKDNMELADKVHDIIEGNKAISIFMELNQGWAFHESLDKEFTHTKTFGYTKYHSDWEWLFPVIDKINALGKEYHLAIFKTYVSVSVEKTGNKFYKDFSLAHSENISSTQTSREAAYKVVVKFVKWYNEHLKTIEDGKH